MIMLVYSYYNNPQMLERHCAEWRAYDAAIKPHLRAIIVDDGSERAPAISHVTDPGFPVSVYRITTNVVWNLAGARNLGMHHAPDGWCLLTDIDHLLTAPEAVHLVAMTPRAGRYYIPSRVGADGHPLEPHSNSYLLHRSLYWATGGCDEDFAGFWGGGEGPFRRMIRTLAKSASAPFRLTHFNDADISDAQTTDWGRLEIHWSHNPDLVRKSKRPYRAQHPLRFPWVTVPLP